MHSDRQKLKEITIVSLLRRNRAMPRIHIESHSICAKDTKWIVMYPLCFFNHFHAAPVTIFC